MILDSLGNASRYLPLNPRFAEAFAFLATADLLALETEERHRVGDEIDAVPLRRDQNGPGGVVLERHERELDIHVTLDGVDVIGWRDAADLTDPIAEFDRDADIQKFRDVPTGWVTVPAGAFAICFPGDAHGPHGGEGAVRKIVLKLPA